MHELVRQNLRFFAWAMFAALVLRLTFFFWIPRVTDDSRYYADLAKNWLQHGTYGISNADGTVEATFARLPGYPAFLAFVFALTGIDNYRAALLLQILVDLGTCFLAADLARRCISPKAAKAAFLLCALCPFLANYASAALTETLEIFFTVLALDLMVGALDSQSSSKLDGRAKNSNLLWAACGLAIGACTLLRPDGGILLATVGLYLGFLLLRAARARRPAEGIVRAGFLVAALALAPLGLWGWRNWHTLHRLEFLAPRYANQYDEFVPAGFNRWVRTWIADYASTEEVYWNVPGDKIDPQKLPDRTFDSTDQKQRTLALLDAYNQNTQITPQIDAQFQELAAQRIRAHPFRYYVWLPALKIVDMWLRPRTELLPPDSRWYEFTDDLRWQVLAIALGVINLFYVVAAVGGVISRHRKIAYIGLPLLLILLRSLFLGTLENPESRYTLECYPAVILLASVWWTNTASAAARS